MRFGLTILPEHTWPAAEPLWREAEALGFDHAWTFDHVTWGGLPDSPWFAALPTLAAAAAVTDRIAPRHLRHLAQQPPPRAAMREVLALDDISRGRFLLGIGSGGDLDSRIMGEDLPLKARVDRFHEFTELLDRLLRDDHVSAEGRYYTARDVRTLARAGARHGRRQPGAPRDRGQRTPLDPARRRARRRLDDLRRHRRHRRRVVGPHRRPFEPRRRRARRRRTRPREPDPLPQPRLGPDLLADECCCLRGRCRAVPRRSASPTSSPTGPAPTSRIRARATCSSWSRAT